MLTLLKASTVAAGVVAATVTGSNDGTVLWSGLVNAGSYAGFPGGALAAQTGIGDCSQVPDTTSNDYAIAYDAVSGRWSDQVPVDSSCASL